MWSRNHTLIRAASTEHLLCINTALGTRAISSLIKDRNHTCKPVRRHRQTENCVRRGEGQTTFWKSQEEGEFLCGGGGRGWHDGFTDFLILLPPGGGAQSRLLAVGWRLLGNPVQGELCDSQVSVASSQRSLRPVGLGNWKDTENKRGGGEKKVIGTKLSIPILYFFLLKIAEE